MSPPIWILENRLNFRDLINNEPAYIDAWANIVKGWMFEPARQLSVGGRVTDRGIAMLTIELAFFEPFGSILSGEDSDNASHKTFSEGLKWFANWLLTRKLIGESESKILSVIGTQKAPNMVYSYARCGLMHKMTMQGGRIFIDALETGKYAITDYEYIITSRRKDGSIETGVNIFLIDPWRLLSLLEKFVIDFANELHRSSRDGGELYKKFKQTFERTIVDPGKTYFGL